MTPEYVVCCRVSDPDPACITEADHALTFCAHCDECVRIARANVVHLFDGARPLCIQCFVLVPNTVLVRRIDRVSSNGRTRRGA